MRKHYPRPFLRVDGWTYVVILFGWQHPAPPRLATGWKLWWWRTVLRAGGSNISPTHPCVLPVVSSQTPTTPQHPYARVQHIYRRCLWQRSRTVAVFSNATTIAMARAALCVAAVAGLLAVALAQSPEQCSNCAFESSGVCQHITDGTCWRYVVVMVATWRTLPLTVMLLARTA